MLWCHKALFHIKLEKILVPYKRYVQTYYFVPCPKILKFIIRITELNNKKIILKINLSLKYSALLRKLIYCKT